MRVTIVNGEGDEGSIFDGHVDEVAAELSSAGHDVLHLRLRDMDIRGCKGCWGCWVKTPGQCAHGDDSEVVCRGVLGSDMTLFAAPMKMGFTSALLKRATDKLVPIVHPYIVIEGGEMHHRPRYDHYPLMGLLLGPDADTDSEDIEITSEIWARTARNMKTRLVFTALADQPVEEVAHELATVA